MPVDVLPLLLVVAALIILIAVVLIVSYVYHTSRFSSSDTFSSQQPKQYVLGMLAIIKNEEMVIEEWIQHYIWQGVEHFYIIDNGSTDATHEKLKQFEGIVTFFYRSERHQQVKHYNEIYTNIAKHECDWLIVCDADEYIYNRNRGLSINTYVQSLNYDHVGVVVLYWKMFGSSGYETQPSSIRKYFLQRKQEVDEINCKCIVNTSCTASVGIHDHAVEPVKQQIKRPQELALNHYPIMSKEYFTKVKMTRGGANRPDNVRDMDYFARYDSDTVIADDELANLVPG